MKPQIQYTLPPTPELGLNLNNVQKKNDRRNASFRNEISKKHQ